MGPEARRERSDQIFCAAIWNCLIGVEEIETGEIRPTFATRRGRTTLLKFAFYEKKSSDGLVEEEEITLREDCTEFEKAKNLIDFHKVRFRVIKVKEAGLMEYFNNDASTAVTTSTNGGRDFSCKSVPVSLVPNNSHSKHVISCSEKHEVGKNPNDMGKENSTPKIRIVGTSDIGTKKDLAFISAPLTPLCQLSGSIASYGSDLLWYG